MRDFVNIHDVVDANLRVLEDPRADYRIFNVGGGRPYTVLEFAAIVARTFGRVIGLRPNGTYRFGDTRHIVSDVSSLLGLGWEPLRSAEDSVAEYAAWLRGCADVPDVLSRAEARMRELGVVRAVGG
jgi:dTDP-L-rhamnose 4-epimerase